MQWSVAFNLGLRMAALFLLSAIAGLVMTGAGVTLLATDRWSGVVEADTSGRTLIGAMLTAIGSLWTLIAAMTVLIKSVGWAMEAVYGPVLSDVHARVIYIEQIVPQAAQMWRRREQPEPAEPEGATSGPFTSAPGG